MSRKRVLLTTDKSTTKGNKLFNELFEEYLKIAEIKGLSKYTVTFYREGHRMLNKFIDLENLKCKDITNDLIMDYILYLKGTNVRDTSINTYLKSLNPIFKYGITSGYISKEVKVTELKVQETIKDVYTEEELKLLLKKPDGNNFVQYRSWVAINFLLGTGVRSRELRYLKVKDIDLHEGMIRVNVTKNKRPRSIPISKTLNNILIEYIQFRKNEDDYLFCTVYGEQIKKPALGITIATYCKKRGVSKTSLHLFRHTFAKNWIMSGGDIFRLQKILGHQSLKMVNHYLNIYSEDLKQDFNSFNALEIVSPKNERITIKGGRK